MIKGWLRTAIGEPLVHFLVAGAALFVFMGLFGGEDSSGRSIVIDEAQAGRLAATWEQQWRRQPSPKELDALIRDHIKEEIYFREAMRLGLDADDPVIRRRLRSKMEFLATAQAENALPTDVELKRYYNVRKSRYAADAAYSFDQRYYGEDDTVARNAVAALDAGKPAPVLSIPLPAAMEKAPAGEIAKLFGKGFVDRLGALQNGRWAGPVQSGYGWHAVRVRDVDSDQPPPFAEIRQRVVSDWRAESKTTREAAAYQALLDGYDIRIEKP